MGLFDKVRQVLAKAEKVLPGSRRAADDQSFDDRAFDERVYEDRDDVLGTAQPEPGTAQPEPGGRQPEADAGEPSTGQPDAATPAAAPDGDASGPGTAVSDSEAEQPVPRRYRTHTLQPGQSLADVAEQHGVSVEDVAQLNGVDPELVFAGQVLRIPHG